ncbi:MAG: TetR/AcrR family transcriptional regulator [Bacillota bacterium]|nr:TetR/AcrR family transcriptional regulator [Bacillota bacterium]
MEKVDLSKEKILKYASELIDTEGVRALSVTKVVNNCKISKSTFYKHFSSKEDLISEIKSSSNKDESNFYSIREEILQKAIEEFSKKPYEKIDIDTIASAVGLKRSSIYRYFSSKEELLEASLKNEIVNRKKLEEHLKSIPFEPSIFLQKIFDYAISYFNKKYNNLMFYNALHYSKLNNNIKVILDDMWSQTIKLIEDIFKRGKDEGIFKRNIDCRALAEMTFSYIGGLGIFSYEHYNELGKQFIELLFRDIKI